MRKICTTLGASFTLLLAQAALAGDNCAAPTVVTSGTTLFDNTTATDDGTNAPCAFLTAGVPQDGLDLYFQYTPAPGETTLNINTCASGGHDTTLQVFNACGGTSLACNDDSCGLSSSIVGLAVTPGTPIIIRVASWGAAPLGTAAGVLTITPGVVGGNPGETCSSAIVQNGPTTSPIAFDTTAYTSDGTNPCGGSGPDIFYAYTAAATGSVTISTCGSSFDTTLQAYDSCGGLAVGPCSDDFCGAQSEVSFLVTAGTTYILQIDGFGGASGPGTLSITESPVTAVPNDVCGTASVAVAGTNNYNSTFAVDDGNDALCALGGADNADVWFVYTAPASGVNVITVDTTAGGIADTTLAIWDECPSAGGVEVACDDDSSPNGLRSQISNFAVTPGEDYFIRAASWAATAGGAGVVTITEALIGAPANDTCATASVAIAGSNPFNNILAASDGLVASCAFGGGPDLNDVWYVYTPTTSGFVQFDTLGSLELDDTTLAIFDECGGTEIACNDDAGTGLLSRVVLNVTAGEDYFIRVASFDGSTTGAGDLSITEGVAPPPANDLCANAIAFTGGTTSPIAFDTTLAASEGTNPCGGAGPDIFYAYTASVSGTAVISTCGSTFDTTLQAYDGCGGLAVGGCSDDSCGTQSEVTICVAAGTTYIIQVDGFGGASGVGQLTVTETAGGGTVANDECSGAIAAVVGSNNFDNNCATGGPGAGTCAFGGSDGADVWFSFVATSTCYTFDTLASTGIGDTTIQLFDSCTATTAIGCNDDASGGLLSSLTVAGLSAGNTYFVRVAGWGVAPDRGAGVLTITDNGSCPCDTYAAAPAGATLEAEACGSDANGGCNAVPTPVFEALNCGAVISGTSFKDFGGAAIRDTDWYQFTLSATSDIRISGRSQFNTQLALLNDQCGAGLVVLAEGQEQLAGCSNISLVANALPAGTYRLFVGMAAAQPDTLCGSGANDYWFQFQVNDTGTCDIDFNNNCVFPEDQDVVDFFNVLAGADCATCDSIDFNRDTVFPDDQDVIDFFNVLAGAACPY